MSTLPYHSSRDLEQSPTVAVRQTEHAFENIVSEFESAADEVGMQRPSTAELRELCRQVVDASHQVFTGDIRLRVGRDREIPDDIYFVVDVRTSGTPDAVLARTNSWHGAAHDILGRQWRLFCLSFHIV